MDEAIAFLREACTAEEYVWVSEVFLEVTQRTGSEEFVQAARALLTKYPEESRQYHIADSVAEAEAVLEDMAANPGWYAFLDAFHALVQARSGLSPKGEAAILACNEEMADLICTSLEYAIAYLREGCPGEEYMWVSEVFPEVARRTHSEAFVQVIRSLARRYPRETRRYDILPDIEAAEQALHGPPE